MAYVVTGTGLTTKLHPNVTTSCPSGDCEFEYDDKEQFPPGQEVKLDIHFDVANRIEEMMGKKDTDLEVFVKVDWEEE